MTGNNDRVKVTALYFKENSYYSQNGGIRAFLGLLAQFLNHILKTFLKLYLMASIKK